MQRPISLLLLLAALGACSSGRRTEEEETPSGGGCGNGALDSGETCDPGITSGAGACPTSCDDGNACTVDGRGGSAEKCSAKCVNVPKTECAGGDGCCPTGCTEDLDADCVPGCPNGRKDPGETCDGDCPTSCNDANPCTTDTLAGSAAACTAQCTFLPIAACQAGDQCCPTGCSSANDADCGSANPCGNGRIDAGEACDTGIASGSGACPTSCTAIDACTPRTLVGAGTCSAACVPTAITRCASGDGCCPAGCTGASDADCGGTTTGDIGRPCTDPATCAGQRCYLERESGWTGGYCTKACTTHADCGAGAHCSFGSEGRCLADCTRSTDCRAGYACLDDDADGKLECVPFAGGTGLPGSACTTIANCAGGSEGWCLTQGRGWKGGYCARTCSAASPCPSGSHCTPDGVCLATCTSDANCRGSGYACADVDGDSKSECFVAGTGSGAVAAPCAGPWDCGGGIDGTCLDEWSAGYCTVTCDGVFQQCASTETCITFSDTDASYCLKTCTTTAACRAGYTCQTLNDGVTKICLPP